jgi:mono/diheme cytochrome c family protein
MTRPRKARLPNEAQRRESPDPDEQNRPLPWFLVMLLGAMLMWGAYYIATTPSGTDSRWGDQRTADALRGKPKPAAGAKVDGAPIYAAKCAACHQASGKGVSGVFPPLAASEWVVGSPERLVQILLHGVSGSIVVKGNTYNGVMPAFGNLSDAELAALSTHLRTQWGNAASEVQPDFVTKQREATKGRDKPWAGGVELETLL